MLKAVLLSLAACPALGAVKSSLLMFYETGPEGSGPMPSSLSLAKHATGPPTATVAQYLNDPIGVQAFSAAGGADSPLWSYWPESTDMDLTWELVGSPALTPAGAVDTVVVQYSNELFQREDANCTLWGVSTDASSTAWKPTWTVKVPHCGPTFQPENDDYGQWRSVAITADGTTLVASLVSGNAEVLMGWALATGKQLFSVPTAGGSYGIYLSSNSKWALVASDDGNGGRESMVFSTTTGKQRGTSGCRTPWNIPPALSDDGSVIATGDQNGMRLCAWDEASNAYGQAVSVDIPSRGQTYWFPIVMSVLTVGSSTYAAGTYVGSTSGNVGRFYAVDVSAAMSGGGGGGNYIVLDALLDKDVSNVGDALVRKAGPYWVVGTAGGNANATSPTEYLFAPGTTDSPSLDSPLWSFTGGGAVNNLDVALVSSTGGTTTLQVLAGGPGNIGTGGNGGQVYWHELVVTSA